MKSRLLFVSMILATSAALGDPVDGQTQAAALLSRPQTTGVETNIPVSASSVGSAVDGQASAAALLSRPSAEGPTQAHVTVALPSRTLMSADGQTQAASLLNRPRTT
jgi:hypothetical protein